jgi:glycosyltransferase involved in cell wall biosynthesis
MKVAILSFRMEPHSGGGAPWSAWVLANGLRDAGIDVFGVTTHKGQDETISSNGSHTYRLHPRNVYWVGHQHHRSVASRAVWQLLDTWNPLMFSRIRRILEQERPDIVHVQKLRGLSPSVWQAARSAGTQAVVQTCRDYELLSPEATFSGRIGKMAERDSMILAPYRGLRAWLSGPVNAAVAPSTYTLRTLTDRGFFPNAITRVIPNSHGCTTSIIEERRRHPAGSAREEPTRVLYVGRLEESKGVRDVCAVVEELSSRGANVVLDVAGEGTQESILRERYLQCQAIRFHGPVFGFDKRSLFEECSVVVVPSRWPEVFGNVIVEAFSFGKPVIGTRVGGIPELIAEGRTGWLVDGGDLESMRVLLARIAANPSFVSGLRDNCFEAALSYTTDRLVAAHVALYEELLARKTG